MIVIYVKLRKFEERAKSQLLQETNKLLEKERQNDTLKEILKKKESEYELLERDKNNLKREIETVQTRLKHVTEEGCSLLEDEDSMLRQRESLIRNQKMITHKSEARVSALREIISERKKELSDLNKYENLSNDEFEYESLQKEYEENKSTLKQQSDKMISSPTTFIDDNSSEDEDESLDLVNIRNAAKLSLQNIIQKFR